MYRREPLLVVTKPPTVVKKMSVNIDSFSMFCSSHLLFFLFLVTFDDEVTKNTKILFTFCMARWARRKKKRKENHAPKVTKIPKTKRREYGMSKTQMLSRVGSNYD